jgi:hypothetical protein
MATKTRKQTEPPIEVEAPVATPASVSTAPRIVVLGVTFQPIPDIQAFTPVFGAIGNTTDPVKVEAQIKKQQEAFGGKAARVPFLGVISSIFAADIRNRRDFSSKLEEGKSIALEFWNWLCQCYPADCWPDARDDDNFSDAPRLIGFGIRDAIKVIGAELMTLNQPVPLRFHKDNRRLEDPYVNLVSSDAHSYVTHDVLLRRLGLLPETPEGMVYAPGGNPDLDARMAMSLMRRSQPSI